MVQKPCDKRKDYAGNLTDGALSFSFFLWFGSICLFRGFILVLYAVVSFDFLHESNNKNNDELLGFSLML